MSHAPICLFVFNRLEHTKTTIEALRLNKESIDSDLYIFSDGPRDEADTEKIDKLREYLKTISGFKSVTIKEQASNNGLANSIIDGVTKVVNKHEKVIVLEDDMLTSKYFLQYLNSGLETYINETKVASIHAYTYPVEEELPETFFLKGADCWGWATWKRAWKKFNPNGEELFAELNKRNLLKEFNFNNSYPYSEMLKKQITGKNDSWAIRWYASAYLSEMLTLYPKKSLIHNTGNDDSGTHCTSTDEYNVEVFQSPIIIEKLDMAASEIGFKSFENYFNSISSKGIRRIIKKALNILGLK